MIAVKDLSLHVGEFELSGVSFEIPPRSYATLMGRTGSGKTTLLECIAGLKRVQSGRIQLAGQDVTDWQPAMRNVGYVPQDGALFTTMKVHEQLGFALKVRRFPKELVAARVHELAQMLGIRHLLDRYPRGLSGGEKQRVALGRAIAFRPATLLLDEPLSALDDQTRLQMHGLLRKICQQTHVTVLHVTHSLHEAEELADFQLTLQDGQVLTHRTRPPRGDSAVH